MKRLSSILLLCMWSLCMPAQQHPASNKTTAERKQQLSELTNRYVQTFALEGKTAETFRTIFLEYNKQLQTIKQQYARLNQSTDGEMTEDQQDAIIRNHFARQHAILDTRMTYYDKMRTVLSPSQIQKIYDDEKKRMENLKK